MTMGDNGCTAGSPDLVKSSGWTFGGPTAYRLIGRVPGLSLVVIFRTVFWDHSVRE